MSAQCHDRSLSALRIVREPVSGGHAGRIHEVHGHRQVSVMPVRRENRDRYPPDWKKRSHFVRFIRAKGQCEWCGAPHGGINLMTGSTIILTTAHVHDSRPESASLLNLAALCQACHLKHDRGRRSRRIAREKEGSQAKLELPGDGAICPRCGCQHVISRHVATGSGIPDCWVMTCEECGWDFNQT